MRPACCFSTRGLPHCFSAHVANTQTTTRIKSTVAVTALCPSQLHARLVIVPPPTAASTDGRQQPLELTDVTAAAHALGVRLSSAVGQLWAVRLAVGQPASVELQLVNDGPRDERLRLSVAASDVGVGGGGVLGQSLDGGGARAGGDGAAAAAAGGGGGGAPAAATAGGGSAAAAAAAAEGASPVGLDGSDSGLLMSGSCERVALSVGAGSGATTHRISLLPMRPGLYQLAVTDVAGLEGAGGGGSSSLYLTQDRLLVLVQ